MSFDLGLINRRALVTGGTKGVGSAVVAGPDPTGAGGVLPGFGDQREIELLVEAGFTPLEAKDGLGFDPQRLVAAVRGQVGIR